MVSSVKTPTPLKGEQITSQPTAPSGLPSIAVRDGLLPRASVHKTHLGRRRLAIASGCCSVSVAQSTTPLHERLAGVSRVSPVKDAAGVRPLPDHSSWCTMMMAIGRFAREISEITPQAQTLEDSEHCNQDLSQYIGRSQSRVRRRSSPC